MKWIRLLSLNEKVWKINFAAYKHWIMILYKKKKSKNDYEKDIKKWWLWVKQEEKSGILRKQWNKACSA